MIVIVGLIAVGGTLGFDLIMLPEEHGVPLYRIGSVFDISARRKHRADP